jgi:hypothetical protein
LSFARGDLPGLLPRPHYIGLTPVRFIFLPLEKGKPVDRALSIGRQHVYSVNWRGGMRPKLRISLPKDVLDIGVRGTKRRQLGRAITDEWDGISEEPDEAIMDGDRLEQARDLQTLGLAASAQYVLKQGRPSEAESKASVREVRLEEALAEALFAMRAAGGFLFADVFLQLLLVVLVMISTTLFRQPATQTNLEAEQIARIMISLWLGVGLWRGQSDRRGWAILWAVASLLLFGLSSFLVNDYLGLVIQVVYSASIVLVLTGRSGRRRTLAAIGIYAVGYVGLPAVLLVLSIL